LGHGRVMKVAYTKIVAVSSNEGSVDIKFRPQGSDTGDNPMTLHISPHDTCIHLALSGLDDKRILVDKSEFGANAANIHFGKA
jgi:hypothetical protein